MLSLMKPQTVRDDTPPQRAADLLDAMGITTALHETLIQDETGRQFEPALMNVQGDLVGQFALLLRPEPLGGAEPQIYENGRSIEARAEQLFHHALASVSASPHSLLHELLTEGRARKDQLEAEYTKFDDEFARLQVRLRKWQKRIEQRSNGAGALWRWLIGGGDQLSVVEAAMLWNERETLALQRAALQAAVAIAARLIEMIAQLLAQLDARLADARSSRAQLAHERAQLAQEPAYYAPWTCRVEPQAVVSALNARIDLDGLIADILRRLAKPDDLDLAALVRTMARRAADQALVPLGIADLIELDAGAVAATDSDPLVPIGQTLLERAQRPAWQLARGARPRTETLQITEDGTPLFSLEGLQSASSGGDAWRMGFIEVQLAVAREDLALWREADDLFQAALRQRNLFVIDDLAIAWDAAQGAQAQSASASAPPDQILHNGQHETTIGDLDW